jgi:hypothetical protein
MDVGTAKKITDSSYTLFYAVRTIQKGTPMRLLIN